MTPIAALGLGKLIGYTMILLHEKFCTCVKTKQIKYESKLEGISPIFFDKTFIANLKY